MRRAKPFSKKWQSVIEQLEERKLLAVLFTDDFEGPFPGPWIISSTGPNTSATWGDNQAKFSSGSKSAFAADNGNDFRTTYDNDLNNAMQLQNVSLVGYSSAALSFNYWLNSEANFDFFRVKVGNQGGPLTQVLALTGDQSAAGWQVRNVSLNSFIGQSNLTISFEFASDQDVTNPAPSGVWIDHVQIIGGDPTNLPGSITPGTGQRIWTNPFGDIARNEAINPTSEVDLFAFNPDVSGSYIISTTQGLDTQLRIFNASGQPISPVIDDTFGGETTTQSFFAGNWYYIAVAGYTTATGPYTLNINGPNTSIFNVPVSAPTYAVTVNSSIDWGGELDYFSFTAPAFTDTLTLTTTPSAAVDTVIELYDAAGNLLQSNNSGGAGTQDLLVYNSIVAGQLYYVAVADASRTTTGGYQLKADFDPDSTAGDPPFSINPSAVPSTWIWANPFGDVTTSGNIPTPVKFDLYAFMPDAGGNVVVTTSGPLDTQFRLYNSSGNPISNLIDANGPGGFETLTIGLNSGVWYYIGIGGKGPSTGSYSLSIDGQSSATPAIATPAPAYTGSVDGNLSVGGAREFYQLTAPPNTTTLNLSLTPLTSADTFLELYDASGTLIASSNSGGQGAADVLSNVPISGGATYFVAASGFLRTTTTTFHLQADFDPNIYSVIRGRAFVDRNSNGTADAGEPGIPGWTLYLDLDDDGQHDPAEPIRTTDANGEYAFEDLIANTYHIAQLTQNSWLQTSPGSSGSIASFYPPPGALLAPQPQISGKLQDQFVLDGEKWPQSAPSANVTLTYSYSNLLDGGLAGGLTTLQLRAAIEEALALWAKYAPLTFVEVPDIGPPPSDSFYDVPGSPNLRIGYHFIDGVSNTLAHAYGPPPPPPLNAGKQPGDVHFDSGETWSLNTVGNTIDIIEVAVHEIGHALGLDHETGTTAIMNPFHGNHYDGLGTAFLFPDDIAGIQAIYGTRLPRPGTWRIDLDQGETAADVNFGNFPTVFNGGPDNDQFTFRISPTDSSRVEILHTAQGSTATYSIAKDIYTAPHFNLGAGDDTLTYDPGADPFPFALIFDGGQGNDTLTIRRVPDMIIESDVAAAGMENVEVDGGSLRFLDPQHISSLSIHNTGRVLLSGAFLHVGSLNILDNSYLAADGPVILDSPGVITITNLIKSNNILSSGDISNRRLAAISNAGPLYTTFGGESGLTGNEVLVLYTLIGDLNLDKTVSISDFIDLASHFNGSGTWREGDINYDGLITISDFIDLASNFNSSFAGATTPPAMPPSATSLASADPLSTLGKRHAKKQHRHHYRMAQQIPLRPRLFRFQ